MVRARVVDASAIRVGMVSKNYEDMVKAHVLVTPFDSNSISTKCILSWCVWSCFICQLCSHCRLSSKTRDHLLGLRFLDVKENCRTSRVNDPGKGTE